MRPYPSWGQQFFAETGVQTGILLSDFAFSPILLIADDM